MGMVRVAAAVALGLALTACGGGGGGEDDSTPSGPNAAQGLYSGTTSNGRAASALILSNGQVWAMYSTQANDNVIAGFVRGRVSAANGQLGGWGSGRDYNFEGLGVSSVEGISGNYVPQTSLTATVEYSSGTTVTVNGTYDAAYEDTPTRAAVAGQYEGTVADIFGSDTIFFSISATGVLSGGSFTVDCDFDGQVDPRADANAYDLEVSFEGGSDCAAPGETVRGILVYDPASRRVLGAAELDDRSDGAAFIGEKI